MDKRLPPTALSGAPLEGKHLRIAENIDRGLIRLQTFHRTSGAVESVSQRLGFIPPGAGETVTVQDMQWFWSAPGDWMVSVPAETECDTIKALESTLGNLFVVLKVMTDSRLVLEISGERAREVLARGSTVDFHPDRFRIGESVNTRFAGLPVMIVLLEEGIFQLFADQSVKAYLREWFEAASVSC